MPTEKAHGLQIMKTCEAIARAGVSIELIVPQRVNHLTNDPFRFYNVEQNFKIKKLPCIDLISLPILKKFWFWMETFSFYLHVKKYLKSNKADAYYTRDLPIALWLSKHIKNVFYEAHTLPNQPKKRHKKAWDAVKGLVVISNGIKEDLIKYGVPEAKIAISPDAVDLDQFNVKESKKESRMRLNLPANKKIAVYTGHLYKWKGADLLAQATEKLSDIEIYMVGGTKEDINLFQNKYKFPNLHIVGWQKHDQIPYWLNAADVLVIPNSGKYKISAKYTSPMKFYEYAASGRPIVAAKVSALQEVVDFLDEKGVEMFEPDNQIDLCQAIRKALGLKEYSFVLSGKFSWDNRATRIINFIEKMTS